MRKMLLTLECNGRVLHEVRSDGFKDPVCIGRSAECAWSVADVDHTMSSRHAELYLRRGSIWIRDLDSRNGIVCAGERVTERRIRPGDRLHLGSCTLHAEAIAEPSREDVRQFHQLEQLNGPDAGRIFELPGTDDITIGADPGSAIICLDPLVSREHASVSLKSDGSVWVRDLGSRNGTTVNGTALKKDKERMLCDGDILSVAYIEFRFTDKDVAHPRAHLVRKVGIVAATVAFTLIGYYTYASIRPSARTLLRRALDLAAVERFDEALVRARDSSGARGADAYSRLRAEVLQNIEAWRSTASAWGEIQRLLANRQWDDAQQVSVRIADWNWNSGGAPLEGLRYERAMAAVRAFRAAQHSLENGAGVGELVRVHDELSSAMDALGKADCAPPSGGFPWAGALVSDVQAILPEMDTTRRELSDVEHVVDSLRLGGAGELPVSASQALSAMNRIVAANRARRDAAAASGSALPYRPSPAVESRIAELRTPLRTLASSEAVFVSNVWFVAEARFADVERTLPLPSTTLAGLHPSFPGYAEQLRFLNDELCNTVLKGWRARMDSAFRIGIDPDGERRPRVFRALLSESTADKVLRFVDTPALPPAKAGADGPVPGCAYDAFIGIFDFITLLDSLAPGDPPGLAVSDYGRESESWASAVEAAREACSALKAICTYAETSGPAGSMARLVASVELPGGRVNRIGGTVQKARQLLDDVARWAAVDFPARCERESSARASILGRAITLLFSERIDQTLPDSIARDYRALKKSLVWDGTEACAQDHFRRAVPGMNAHKKAWDFLHRESGKEVPAP